MERRFDVTHFSTHIAPRGRCTIEFADGSRLELSTQSGLDSLAYQWLQRLEEQLQNQRGHPPVEPRVGVSEAEWPAEQDWSVPFSLCATCDQPATGTVMRRDGSEVPLCLACTIERFQGEFRRSQ